MKEKPVSRLVILVLVAMVVIASAIPVLATPTLYSTTSSMSGSFNNYNVGGSLFSLKHKDKDKWGHYTAAAPEEPALMQMVCLLALFAVVIPTAGLLRRKAQS